MSDTPNKSANPAPAFVHGNQMFLFTSVFKLCQRSYLFLLTSVPHWSQSSKEISRLRMHVTVDSKQLLIPQGSKQLANGCLATTSSKI